MRGAWVLALSASVALAQPDRLQPPPASARCGNGKVEIARYELHPAPCMPGRGPCPAAWVPVREQCDGSEFSSNVTCQSYGFDRGTLRCTKDCTVDPSSCVRDPPPEWLKRLIPLGEPSGTSFAVALTGSTTAVASVFGDHLTGRTLQDALTRSGLSATVPVPLYRGDNHSLGDVLIAPIGKGFVIATYHVGDANTALYLLAPDRPFDKPAAWVKGHPVFLGGGEQVGLLGTKEGAVLVGADARPRGALRPLFKVAARGEVVHGAVASVTDGWVVAVGVRQGAERTARIDLGRVSWTGETTQVRGAARINDAYEPLKLAAEGSRAFVVAVKEPGLVAMEVLPGNAVGPDIALAHGTFTRVLAAELRDGALTAWVSGERNRVQRVRHTLDSGAKDVIDLMEGPSHEAVAGGALQGRFVGVVLSHPGDSVAVLPDP